MYMNKVGYFEIQADDPEKAVAFYNDVFGWKFEKDENLPIEYYRIQTSGMNGGLLKRPAKMPPPEHGTNAYVCSIQVEDFDETAEKILKNGGGKVEGEPMDISSIGTYVSLTDTEGNNVGMLQPPAR